MPNSPADIISKEATPPSYPTPAPDPLVEGAKSIHPLHTTNLNTFSDAANNVPENGLPEEEDNAGHPELTNLRNALTTSLASPGGVEFDEGPFHNEAAKDDSIAKDKADFPSTGPTSANKHMSSMSFARTVSEEVSLGEDDEADTEWNIHRTDTDPFKLMAKSDRTNSFPQVPPAHSPANNFEPLHTRGEDTINEVEQKPKDLFADEELGGDADFFSQTAAQDVTHEFSPGENDAFASADNRQTYGGDSPVQEDQESQARYEEGIPLVQPLERHRKSPPIAHAAFEDDDGEGADFFAQVSKSDPAPETRPTLERKSTSQIINSLNFQPHGPEHPAALEEAEEHDTESSQGPKDGSTTIKPEAPVIEQEEPSTELDTKLGEGDLAEKWKAALTEEEFLDDEDELLPDDEPTESKALDPADVFGSDDEGFLEDSDEQNAAVDASLQQSGPGTHPNGHVTGFDNLSGATHQMAHPDSNSSRYLPANLPATKSQPSTSYAPLGPQFTDLSRPVTASALPATYAAPPLATFPGQQLQPQRPELPKAESFADKNKGGYSSPYDLPMDVVKPRKRASMQHISRGFNQFAQPPPISPPRSASVHAQEPPPSRGSISSLSPPTTSYSAQPSTLQPAGISTGQAPPSLKSKVSSSNFFEDLPLSSIPKPAARHQAASRPQSSHAQTSVPPPSPGTGYAPPPPPGASYALPPHQPPHAASHPAAQGLVAPERVSPYASVPSHHATVPGVASRYSPAPSQPHTQTGPPPPVSQSRYSPALSAARQGGPAYATAPSAAPPPPLLPHLPRTSSPLAHFERSPDSGSFSSHSQASGFDRRSSSSYESSLKPHHLPPTREVDEIEEVNNNEKNYGDLQNKPGQQHTSYPPSAIRPMSQTPPPPHSYASKIGQSPPKRATSSAVPQQATRHTTPPHAFVPPKRSQTQSPGTAYTGNNLQISSLTPHQRPASTEVPLPPRGSAGQPSVPSVSTGRSRGFSIGFNYIAPTDGLEHDPLQRWRGAPVFSWGVGGTFITSFPQDVPRYVNQTPMTIRTPGEVKIRNIKDVDPLPERLTRFPGPLKGKSKKKDVVAWLTSGIQMLEQDASYLRTSATLTHEDKRTEERILLWKILRIFIEHDGILEGNAMVDLAVRLVLSPDLDGDASGNVPLYATGADLTGISKPVTGSTRADPVDPTAVDELRKFLLRGDREKAVWEAVDKRLWAHAMLISNTVSKELFRQVAQEFVQKEVRSMGENTESLAALYEIFAGNFEESIDELVAPSARAGFQMVSTSDATGPSKDALHGLDRWRETLGLVLSNRSADDSRALNALGKLLSGYGRAEAGHICFLFARSHSVFGGIDDPLSCIVLVGSDHLREPFEFDKEMEPILLSEVFEYGMSLSSTTNVIASTPHLAVYKLQHAKILAEYGYREKALQYCEAIASSITSQTRRSPYHHKYLIGELDDLSQRLKQSPKDEKSSWVSKPSIDKVSSSVWSTFNKFVAGDEVDAGTPGSATGNTAEHGPFARLVGGTPTISRTPSTVDLYGSYSSGAPVNGAPATKAVSRYAPGAVYTPTNHEPHSASSYQSAPLYNSQPRSSFEDTPSGGYQGTYQEQARPEPDFRRSSPPMLYAPQKGPVYTPPSSYTPTSTDSPLGQPRPLYTPQKSASNPELPVAATSHFYPPHTSYEPPAPSYEPSTSTGYEPPNSYDTPSGSYEQPTSTYEPPTGGYEPPSYEPATMSDEPDSALEAPQKKKSFMDDDEDDVPALKAASAPREKTKAEKDREADEAFRKAAEADGMHFLLLLISMLYSH